MRAKPMHVSGNQTLNSVFIHQRLQQTVQYIFIDSVSPILYLRVNEEMFARFRFSLHTVFVDFSQVNFKNETF